MSQCPFCADPVGAKGLLPEGENTCPVCGNEIPSVAAATASSVYQGPAPLFPARGRGLDRAPGEIRKQEPSEDDAEEPASFATQLRQVDVGTAAGFALGGVALVTASIPDLTLFTKPLSCLGLLLGVVGGVVPAVRAHKKVAIPAVTCGLCLLVFLFAGDWPRWSAPQPIPAMAITLHQAGMVAPRPVAEDEWLDASTCAFRASSLQVQIVSVHLGQPELHAAGRVTHSPDKCLMIKLQVIDAGTMYRPNLPYISWADERNAPSKHPALLTDNTEHAYVQRTFEAGTKIAGRTYVHALTPPALRELLVFAAPDSNIEYLRLKLPASAFGAPGEYRFQIPRSMIEGL